MAEIDWSPDGKQIATASYDGSACIWNAETGDRLAKFHEGHTILCCADWSPDSTELAWGSASDESLLRVRDNRTGKIQELTGNTESVWEVDWNQAGDRLVVGTMTSDPDSEYDKNNLMIWKKETDKWTLQSRTAVPKNIEATEWSPDNTRIAVVYAGFCSIHDGETLEVIKQAEIPGANTITWNPAGKTLACGTYSGDILILHEETLEIEQRIQAHFAKVMRLQPSPDNSLMASAGGDGAVKIWSTEDWTLRETFVGHSGIVTDITWRPDSKALASTGYDGIVNIWSIENATNTFLTPAPSTFAWTEDNLIRSLSGPTTVIDRDPFSGSIVRTIELPARDSEWSLKNSSLFTRIATVEGEKSIEVLTLDPMNRIAEFTINHQGQIAGPILDIKHDLTSLAIQFKTTRARAFAANLEDGKRFPLGQGRFVLTKEIRWSPDGSTIAIVGGGIDSDDGTPAWAGWLYLLAGGNRRAECPGVGWQESCAGGRDGVEP